MEATIEQLLRQAQAVVDVRSPAEYAKGAIAGASNIPLFSNGERAEIGTLYKLLGKKDAVDRGLNIVGERLRTFIQAFEPYRHESLVVYCARGGMRSSAVVGLLSSLGYQVSQLPGGYKGFRNYLLNSLSHALPPHLIVIHGKTGVGKTLLLKRLENALDLEEAAQHRSSLFGAVNLHPRTQQQFEAHLLPALNGLDYRRPVWVEGESRKIGTVTMPDALRTAMVRASCVLVTASLETRIDRIVAEYGGQDPDTVAQLCHSLESLRAFFGRERTREMMEQIRAGDFRPVVATLLRDYYDPRYEHAMRGYTFAQTLDSESLDAAAETLRRFADAESGDSTAVSLPEVKKGLQLRSGLP